MLCYKRTKCWRVLAVVECAIRSQSHDVRFWGGENSTFQQGGGVCLFTPAFGLSPFGEHIPCIYIIKLHFFLKQQLHFA